MLKRYHLIWLFVSLLALAACSEGEDPIIEPTPSTPTEPSNPSNPSDPSNPSEPSDPSTPTGALCAVMHITTQDGAPIDSRDYYIPCQIKIEGQGIYEDYTTPEPTANESGKVKTDSIRGRGNSTWLWYDKKPYKIKLGKNASLLGIPKGEKYVLLANYRDPTRQMNAVAFDMARYAGLPFTNTNRFVEVYLNDKYIGLYQLTEQIERGKGRVEIDKERGLLLSLDFDDGPTEAPEATDNFLSKIFHSSYSPGGLPVCVKYPKDPSSEQLADIREEFAQLEQVIKDKDYERLKQICDVRSMMDFLIIQELTRNVELVTPRSMYLHHNADGLWTFGPVWDFDGGFAYDWGEHHGYFGSQSWLMGPRGAYDIPDFFDRMFDCEPFLSDYKARFREVGKPMVAYALQEMTLRLDSLSDAIARDEGHWPMSVRCNTECSRLSSWLNLRTERYSDLLKSW